MKNINRKSEFDEQWQEAFKNAEMAPPEGVWDKIDASLSKEEAGYFKKRAFLFKLLAAASIAFALGVSIFSINYYVNDETSGLANKQGVESIVDQETLALENALTEDRIVEQGEGSALSDSQVLASDESTESTETTEGGSDALALVTASDQQEEDQYNSQSVVLAQSSINQAAETVPEDFDRNFVNINELASMGITTSSREDMVYTLDHIYLIPIMPRGASKMRKEEKSTEFLAGLDFSTGIFDPNFEQGGGAFASAAGAGFADARVESVNNQLASFNATNKDFLLIRTAGQETKPELTYSYGANFGFKVLRKVIIQTGVSYRRSNTTTTTSGYFEDPNGGSQIPIVATYQYQLDGLSAVKRTEETSLTNQYEFASIPLRAGYMLLDKRLNLALMAGISSEIFLNNQITSGNENFETLSNSAGDGSPYRSVYFNGSLGTMLGYSFAKNYLITVEPSYRFAVNSFTRDDFYLNSYPSSFMLSFGVAYNFK